MNTIKIKEKVFITTETYEINSEGFFVDIVTRDAKFGKQYDVYLYHSDYGIKMLMFGLLAKDIKNHEYLLEIINANLLENMMIYMEDYMD